jgi:hypothetical protein
MEYIESPLFQRLAGNHTSAIPDLDSQSFPYIANARLIDPNECDESQQAAGNGINSLHPVVAIEGPPGTGKTYIGAKSLLARHWEEASNRAPQEVTVVATMTNLAGINMALELEKQGFLQFRLAISETFYGTHSKKDGGVLKRLEQKRLLWRPGHLQGLNHVVNSKASQLHKKHLQGARVIVGTVRSSCNSDTDWTPPHTDRTTPVCF